MHQIIAFSPCALLVQHSGSLRRSMPCGGDDDDDDDDDVCMLACRYAHDPTKPHVFSPHLIDEVHALMVRHDDGARVLDMTSHKFFSDFLVAASASTTYIKASGSSGSGSPGPSTGTGGLLLTAYHCL
jgi:hypothetical protein